MRIIRGAAEASTSCPRLIEFTRLEPEQPMNVRLNAINHSSYHCCTFLGVHHSSKMRLRYRLYFFNIWIVSMEGGRILLLIVTFLKESFKSTSICFTQAYFFALLVPFNKTSNPLLEIIAT